MAGSPICPAAAGTSALTPAPPAPAPCVGANSTCMLQVGSTAPSLSLHFYQKCVCQRRNFTLTQISPLPSNTWDTVCGMRAPQQQRAIIISHAIIPPSLTASRHHGAHRHVPSSSSATAHPAAVYRPMRFACGHGATTRHERSLRVCFLFFASCPWAALEQRVERGARPLFERPKALRDGEAQAHVW